MKSSESLKTNFLFSVRYTHEKVTVYQNNLNYHGVSERLLEQQSKIISITVMEGTYMQ